VRGHTMDLATWSWKRLRVPLVAAVLAVALVGAACSDGDDEPAPAAAAVEQSEAPQVSDAADEQAEQSTPSESEEEDSTVEAETDTATTDDRPSDVAEEEDQPSNEVQDQVEEEQAPPPPDFPITLTDDTGVEVTVPERPKRVIVALPSAVDLVIDLGLSDRLVGVDDFSLDRVPDVASVGGNNFTFNIEAVAELEPDLVIVAVGGTEELAQQAREIGLPVYSIAFPAEITDVFDQLRLVGRLLGESAAADAVVADLEDRFRTVTQRVEQVTASDVAPLRVYLEVDQSTPTQPFSVGPGSLHQQIIELAGGQNIFGEAESAFPQVNWESIIAADPEVILLLNSKEFGDDLAFNPISVEEVGQRTGWDLTSAVRNGMVVPLPNDLFSVGAGLVEALEQIAEALAEARALSEAEDDAA